MQDDNRGLGQGLKDNKKTVNRFRLLLERRSMGNKVTQTPFSTLPESPSRVPDGLSEPPRSRPLHPAGGAFVCFYLVLLFQD